jgi:DNA-binding MarR family transcriptional regulator
MTPLDVFLEMLDAYNVDLGDAFPSANLKSVLLVLRECNKPIPKSQKQIADATGIAQPNVAKLMKKMIARGWLKVAKRETAAAARTVQVTFSGFGMLDSFEKACRRAAKNISKPK